MKHRGTETELRWEGCEFLFNLVCCFPHNYWDQNEDGNAADCLLCGWHGAKCLIITTTAERLYYYPGFKRGSNRLCSFVMVMNSYIAIQVAEQGLPSSSSYLHALLANRRLFWRPGLLPGRGECSWSIEIKTVVGNYIYEPLRKQRRESLRSKRSKRMLPFYLPPKFSRLSLGLPLLSYRPEREVNFPFVKSTAMNESSVDIHPSHNHIHTQKYTFNILPILLHKENTLTPKIIMNSTLNRIEL